MFSEEAVKAAIEAAVYKAQSQCLANLAELIRAADQELVTVDLILATLDESAAEFDLLYRAVDL